MSTEDSAELLRKRFDCERPAFKFAGFLLLSLAIRESPLECWVTGVLRIFRESKVRCLRTREDGTIFQITMGVNTTELIVWDRGRPARK